MSSAQTLQQFVSDRLAAAARDIFGVFQQTLSELESELDRQRALVSVLLKQPVVRLHRIDVQHQRPSQDRDTVELKTEDVEVLVTRRWTPYVKKEEDEDGWGGPEPARCAALVPHLKSCSSESETDDSEDWGKGDDPPVTSQVRGPGGGPEPARCPDPLQRSFSSDVWRQSSHALSCPSSAVNPSVCLVKVFQGTYRRLAPKPAGPEPARPGSHLQSLSSESGNSEDGSISSKSPPVKRPRPGARGHPGSLVCARCGRSCDSRSQLIRHRKLCAAAADAGPRDVSSGLPEHVRRERLRRALLDHQYCRPLAV